MKQEISTNNLVSNIQQQATNVLLDGIRLSNKDYLVEMPNWQVQPLFSNSIDIHSDVRIFKVERIVLENKQAVLESMTAAYTALGAAGFSVFILLDSNGAETYLYLGVRGQRRKMQGGTAGRLLEETFKGHFSGSLLSQLNGQDTQSLLNKFHADQDGNHLIQSVTAVSSIPSLSTDDREHFSQGLERFIDSAEGHCYQALILAESVPAQQLSQTYSAQEQIATMISPQLKLQMTSGENQSQAASISLNETFSKALGESLTLTESKTTTDTKTQSETFGTNQSTSGKSMLSKVVGRMAPALTLTGPVGMAVGGALTLASSLLSDTHTQGSSHSTSNSSSHAESIGNSYARGKTTTETRSYGQTTSDTQTIGSSRQVSFETIDKRIEQWLKRIDQQLQRLDEAQCYGGWESAAYFAGKDVASTEALASIFLGLMRGNKSNGENFALTTWSNKDKSKLNHVLNWLKNLSHPRLTPDGFNAVKLDYFTPATLVSTKEIALQLGLPRRSTSATPVIETQSFGRSIQLLNTKNEDETKNFKNTSTEVENNGSDAQNKSIKLGTIRHLWTDTQQKVNLTLDELSSHLFVTGSTGSGKSNTVYQILNELTQQNPPIPFLVIEPAKGEYKHVFGNKENVRVFSTNAYYADVLKINPFKFPEGIHVFEHIDRLVEIFNVCWPMYAAMPAVLKDAILLAYENVGWDLNTSENQNGKQFPNFRDLLDALEMVIKNSAYSEEVKSNYAGSLMTRVKSLTNGLNGQIFAADEIGDEILFDQNVIIDLSRVGSQETKSLIMGILILRLSEYRMTNGGINSPLRHVTVLEEAHNILKRTSTEQSSESANVAGKAVEMLSNAIAEMRTYGEGFIIADQSPNAVDISAIRNTNTKIIMRLPDEADRNLAGKAAALNDDQVAELAKLPKGSAVVYQNNWLEAVLCQVNEFKSSEGLFRYQPALPNHSRLDRKKFNHHLARLLLSKSMLHLEKSDLDMLEANIGHFGISQKHQNEIRDVIHSARAYRRLPQQNAQELKRIFLDVTVLGRQATQLIEKYRKQPLVGDGFSTIQLLSDELQKRLTQQCGEVSKDLSLAAIDSCLSVYREQNTFGKKLYHAWIEQQKLISLI